jgi:ubiquinone/menaquinone biosynthesis C-methylase UbiE
MKNGMIESTYTDDKTQKYYAWRASNYDDLAEWEQAFHWEAVNMAEAQIGQRVLVVACGTGRGIPELAQAVGPTGRVDALDLSEPMIEQARAKCETSGLGEQVHFKQGNAKELPYPDETFDLVYNGYMLDLIPLDGFEPILKEMQRVLKPGGKLVLLNMSKPDEKKTFYESIYKWTGIPCRPVLMAPYLKSLGFINVQRVYRALRPHNLYERMIGLLWGQEIVTAQKAEKTSIADVNTSVLQDTTIQIIRE